jgi:hypothetical protein
MYIFLIGQSEKSGIEIESEYQLTGHSVYLVARKTFSKLIIIEERAQVLSTVAEKLWHF